MNPQAGVVLAQATLHEDVVGLLEADPVAGIVSHLTILDDGAKAAIEKNAGATTAVEMDIFLLVPFDDEIFHTRTFQVVAGDDRKDGGGLALFPSMQSAFSGVSMENVLPFCPVIRATVVWNPPDWLSQIAMPSPTLKPSGLTNVTCSSP